MVLSSPSRCELSGFVQLSVGKPVNCSRFGVHVVVTVSTDAIINYVIIGTGADDHQMPESNSVRIPKLLILYFSHQQKQSQLTLSENSTVITKAPSSIIGIVSATFRYLYVNRLVSYSTYSYIQHFDTIPIALHTLDRQLVDYWRL